MYKEAFKCDKQVSGKIEKWCNSTMQYHFQLEVCMGRVERIFWPNPPWWVKKNSTHHINPTHMGRVKPMGLANFIIIIIIKLSRKKYKY